MAKKTILTIITCVSLLISTVVPAFAERLDTPDWRADYFQKETFVVSGQTHNQYWYRGSMKGVTNAIPWSGVEDYYSAITLWDIWGDSSTPVYLEDHYTYTITFKIAINEEYAFWDPEYTKFYEGWISAASSAYKYEIYGQNMGMTSLSPSINAKPLTVALGGYSVPLDTFFENIAVGCEVLDDTTAEVSIVFSTPARTLEHQWDIIIVDLSLLYNDWVDDENDDYIYLANLDVVYDRDQSEYNAALEAGLTEISGKVDNLNNTIQQGQDQAHQDANDIKDAINNQGEKEKNEASTDGNKNVAALQGAMSDFSLTTYSDAINTLTASFSYEGTDTTWTLPSSGKVPFLEATLWEQQEIDLCPDYIVNLESFNLIKVVMNFIVAIGCVYVTVAVFNDLLSTMNGESGSIDSAAKASKGKGDP